MVDVSNTAFSGTIQPEVPLVQPVVDQSGAGFASGLAQGVSDVNSIFTASQQNNAKKNSHIIGSVAADITEQISLLADGVDQGSINRAEALTRLRAKTNEWMANNPGQESLIQEYINKGLGSSGIAPELSEDTTAEKAKKAVLQEALQYGWSFDPSMKDDDAIKLYNNHKRDLQDVENIATKISLAEGDGKIVSAQLKSEATMSLHSAIHSGLPWVQGKIDEGFKKLQSTSDPTERAAIISDVETQITNQTAVIDDLRTKSENAIDTSYMTQGYKDLLQNFKDVANGKETQAQFDNVTATTQSRIGAMINQDPKTAAAIMFDKLLGFSDANMAPYIQGGAMKIITQLNASGDPTGGDSTTTSDKKIPDIVGKDNDITTAFAITANELKNMNSDPSKVNADTAKEANAKIIGMFKSVARHSAAGMDPTELNSFMQFMADPNTGAWIEGHMKDLAPQVSTDARQIVEQYYQKVGVDLINERWGAASVTVAKGSMIGPGGGGLISDQTTQITDAIKPVWNGSGIEFQVDDAFKNDPLIANQAKKLNADVSGPLNNMVRAQAHMQGSRDYKKIYDEQFAKRLWVAGEDMPGDITDLNAKGIAKAGQTNMSGYLAKISAQESGGNPDAKSKTSSASGSFGIIDRTYNIYAKRLGLTGDKNDPANQQAVAAALTRDNQVTLEANNIPVNDANQYALHFLGSQDGPEVLSANDNDLVSDYVSPSVLKANPQLVGMTVGEFKAFTKKVVK